jgi:predicted nucleotidyltransferase
MKIDLVCQMIGGSQSYGLNTPESDLDQRGIYLNMDRAHVIGLRKHEHQQKQGNGVDEVFTEFRNALKLLQAGNTQMIELLFNENWVYIGPEWKLVIENRRRLISSGKLFSCLRGYGQNELKLALGLRTGALGGKRKGAIERWGYSPKNVVQLIRLYWAGSVYFQKGVFPVRVADFNSDLAEQLFQIKTRPEIFSKDRIEPLAKMWEENLVKSYECRSVDTEFNEEVANNICLKVYAPIVRALHLDYLDEVSKGSKL